jgi:hypothetical protein
MIVTKTFAEWAATEPGLGMHEPAFRAAYGATADQHMDLDTVKLRLNASP